MIRGGMSWKELEGMSWKELEGRSWKDGVGKDGDGVFLRGGFFERWQSSSNDTKCVDCY